MYKSFIIWIYLLSWFSQKLFLEIEEGCQSLRRLGWDWVTQRLIVFTFTKSQIYETTTCSEWQCFTKEYKVDINIDIQCRTYS